MDAVRSARSTRVGLTKPVLGFELAEILLKLLCHGKRRFTLGMTCLSEEMTTRLNKQASSPFRFEAQMRPSV